MLNLDKVILCLVVVVVVVVVVNACSFLCSRCNGSSKCMSSIVKSLVLAALTTNNTILHYICKGPLHCFFNIFSKCIFGQYYKVFKDTRSVSLHVCWCMYVSNAFICPATFSHRLSGYTILWFISSSKPILLTTCGNSAFYCHFKCRNDRLLTQFQLIKPSVSKPNQVLS